MGFPGSSLFCTDAPHAFGKRMPLQLFPGKPGCSEDSAKRIFVRSFICEDYRKTLEQEDLYRFSRRDLPHFTGYNAYLSLDLPLSEVVFYALILRELLLKKDAFPVHSKRLMDENKNGLGGIQQKTSPFPAR